MVNINNGLATIVPKLDFIGTKFMFFIANDSKLSAVSNVFKIEIINPSENRSEELIQLPAVVIIMANLEGILVVVIPLE